MLKKLSIRKLTTASCSLIIVLLIYLFPTTDKEIELEKEIIYKDNKVDYVYLLDSNNYVSKVEVDVNNDSDIEVIKEKLLLLIDNNSLSSFKSLIPSNTKLLNISIKDNEIYLDFSKELLDVRKDFEEKMIESIIYTCTNNIIKNVYLSVEGVLLDKLPHSNKILNYPLTRKYGINKKYDITSMNNLTYTTVYYMSHNNEESYYVPVTYIANDVKDKVSVIIDELKSSVLFQDNLYSYLSQSAKIKEYEIVKNTMHLTFDNNIFSGLLDEEVIEEVKYTISFSIMDSYGVDDVIINY